MNVAVKEKAPSVKEALAAKPDGVLEMIAAQCAVPLARVFEELPEGAAKRVSGNRFGELWQDLALWGEVLFIAYEGHRARMQGPVAAGLERAGLFQHSWR
jgi:putative heme iron utilization protein